MNKREGLLSRVTQGPLRLPYRILCYGTDGIGKTTLAAGAPEPIVAGPETGSANVDVVPVDGTRRPETLGRLQPEGNEVHGRDLAGTCCPGRRTGEQSDRPYAKYRNAFARPQADQVHRMQANR